MCWVTCQGHCLADIRLSHRIATSQCSHLFYSGLLLRLGRLDLILTSGISIEVMGVTHCDYVTLCKLFAFTLQTLFDGLDIEMECWGRQCGREIHMTLRSWRRQPESRQTVLEAVSPVTTRTEEWMLPTAMWVGRRFFPWLDILIKSWDSKQSTQLTCAQTHGLKKLWDKKCVLFEVTKKPHM